MGLPRRLVDVIFEYLKTDRKALLSCSLTCKAFLCSARRAIHERLYVQRPRPFQCSRGVTEWRWISDRSYLHILSLADDAGLVQYTRHIIFKVGQLLTPRSLRPHISTFQKYVWLTTLTITRFDPTPFLPVFDRYFHHLSHSITSIHFILPRGTPYATVDFVSRFRCLDDLELNPVMKPPRRPQSNPNSLGPHPWFTPFRGTFRIVNTDSQRTSSLEPFLHFPGGLRFRFLEVVCCTNISMSGLIRKCSSTLESVTCKLHCRKSTDRSRSSADSRNHHSLLALVASQNFFPELNLGGCPELRVFEVRIEASSCTFWNLVGWLTRVLDTVTSRVFSRFFLSLDDTMLNLHVFEVTPETTSALDELLARLSYRSGMRFIIKGKLSLVWRQVLGHCFPHCTGAGALRFDFPDPDTVPLCGQGRALRNS